MLFFSSNLQKLEFVVPTFVESLCKFVKQINEKLIAQTGVGALKHFISETGALLSPLSWDLIVDHLCDLALETTPRELLEAADRKGLSES